MKPTIGAVLVVPVLAVMLITVGCTGPVGPEDQEAEESESEDSASEEDSSEDPAAALVLSTDALSFAETETELLFEIENGGTEQFTWSVSTDQDWMSFSATSGTLENETDSVTVTVDRANLSEGTTYNGAIEVSTDFGVSKSIDVQLAVPEYAAVAGHAYFSGTTVPVSGVTVSLADKSHTTNTDGAFELVDVPVGEHTITATKDGYDDYQKTINVPSSGMTLRIDMTGGIVFSLSGTVTDTSSQGLSGVAVTILNPDGSSSELVDTTDENGNYQIPSVPQGQRQVRFSRDWYDSTTESIYIANSDKAYDVALHLSPSPVVISVSDASTQDNLQMQLQWNDEYDVEAGYSIERKRQTEPTFAEIGTVGENSTSFMDSSVAGDVAYEYRIRAYNDLGYSSYSGKASIFAEDAGTLKWAFETGGAVDSSPAMDATGRLYVGSGDGHLYALESSDGTKEWATEITGDVNSSPAIGADGTVFVGNDSGRLIALDSGTGSILWWTDLGVDSWLKPAIASDGTVCVTANGGSTYAVDPADGSIVWSHATSATTSPAIDANGTIYVGSGARVYAFASDGTVEWQRSTIAEVSTSPAIAGDGTVYVGCEYYPFEDLSRFYALDPTDGSVRWSFDAVHYFQSSAAIGADGTVFLGPSYDTVVGPDNKAFALNPTDGGMLWSLTTDSVYGDDDPDSSAAIASDGTVHFGSDDKHLYAVDSTDGTVEWRYETDGPIDSSPLVGPNGTVYVGSDDGKVYAIGGSGTSLADSEWPMFGRGPRHTSRVP